MDKSQKTQKDENIFHDLKRKDTSYFSPKIALLFLGVIAAGIFTGYFLSQTSTGSISKGTPAAGTGAVVKNTVYGSNDTTTFKDSAEGVLQAGGIDGEGQYHLVRPGGDSQNVYMTSSLVDLSQFVGRSIKVWGQTQAAMHAGWLMDVGRVEVLK